MLIFKLKFKNFIFVTEHAKEKPQNNRNKYGNNKNN